MKNSIAISAATLTFLALPALGLAQGTPRDVSPATALDFSKPQFDTETPHYDVAGVTDKAASTVVADVGGRAIILGDVADVIRALPATVRALPFDTLYPAVLNQLIQIQAMVVRAEKLGFDKDPIVVRRVKAAGDRALSNELMQRQSSAGITEKMILDRYDRDYAKKPGPEEVHVRVILVATRSEASAIIAKLAGGADFATVARESSRDNTGPQGGDLGFVRRANLTPEVGAVAFALKPSETTAYPVETSQGWFVVRVEDRRQGAPLPFLAVKEDIRAALMREGVAALAQAALSDVPVQRFGISGKDVQAQVQQRP